MYFTMLKSNQSKKPKIKSIYLHFPSKLTEEELMLQSKYSKLRKKKKAIQKQKVPSRREPEQAPVKKPRSPTIAARDAREIAKKLIKSGAISINKSTLPEKEGFKRSLGLERRLSLPDRTVSGYKPFNATIHDEYRKNSDTVQTQTKTLQFVTAEDVDNLNQNNNIKVQPQEDKIKPKSGHTLFVSGTNITEKFVRDAFSTFGKITHIAMEEDKNRAFVTLDKLECSRKAVDEMNGSVISDIYLKVAFARRQPNFSYNKWHHLSEHQHQKTEPDKRDIVVYDSDSVFDCTIHE